VVTFLGIAAGRAHTCAATSDRQVACWGANGDGQLGADDGRPRSTTPTLAALPTGAFAARVYTGGRVSCALGAAGEAWCWGRAPVSRATAGGAGARGRPRRLPIDAAVATLALGERTRAR
jgi:alpha-tubulin suppressor-like RCC1 family protein